MKASYQYWLRSLENDARPSRLRVNDDHGELGLLHLYVCDSTHGDPELTYRIAKDQYIPTFGSPLAGAKTDHG